MRLQTLSFVGALAVMAIPLSAGAQSLAYDRSARNAQEYHQSVEQCPAGWVWEDAGYLSSGKWRAPHCAPRNLTDY